MPKLLSASLLVLLFSTATYFFTPAKAKESLTQLEPPTWLLPGEKNTIEVFEKRAPLVVYVHNLAFRQNFFTMQATQVQQGTGSGFIWDDKGHIVTNYHVVRNADKLAITLKNGQTLDAKRVGVDPRKDLAVLKVNPKHLPKSGFSSWVALSSQLRVGQKAIAIGNPFGLDHTLTVGAISALNRSFATFDNVTIRDMIQTDAAINPGNSGGPLLDSRGFLIGMNTGIFSNSGSSAGIGFAVPSDTIKRVVSQIIKYGKVIQPGLGIQFLDPRTARYYGIDNGVLITSVVEGSGADRAGLRGTYTETRFGNRKIVFGDVIIGINDDDVEDFDDLYNALTKRKVGEMVKVHYLRDGKRKSVRVKLSPVGN